MRGRGSDLLFLWETVGHCAEKRRGQALKNGVLPPVRKHGAMEAKNGILPSKQSEKAFGAAFTKNFQERQKLLLFFISFGGGSCYNKSSSKRTAQNKKTEETMVKKLLRGIFCILLLAAAGACYARWCEPRWVEVKHVTLKGAFEKEYTVAAFGDTHIGFYENEQQFQKVIDTVNKEKPDAVLFLGDLFDEYNSYTGDIQTVIRDLSQLEAGTKLAVMGNHDVGGGAESVYQKMMKEAGFSVLRNQAVEDGQINFIGAEDSMFYHPETAQLLRDDRYNMVISHEPDYAKQAGKFGLLVAGHTHGGQIALPFYGALVKVPGGKTYTAGLYETENGKVYVNRGIGTTHWPLRFFARPEITIFHFLPADA